MREGFRLNPVKSMLKPKGSVHLGHMGLVSDPHFLSEAQLTNPYAASP